MNIKINAKLSAYSKLHGFVHDTCEHEIVSPEMVDTLFDENAPIVPTPSGSDRTVSFEDIDSLFRGK